MQRSLGLVLLGTFTLRFSTGLTGGLLSYYLARLPEHGGQEVHALTFSFLTVAFYGTELLLSTPFGLLSDRLGHHRIMQLGPLFGGVAVVLTWATTDLLLLGGTRILEGASTAASVPSILGFIAAVTAGDELLRGRAAARFEGATLAGLGVGLVAAAPLYKGIGDWGGLGRDAFLLNGLIYVLSFCIYRFGVDPANEVVARHAPGSGRTAPPTRVTGWRAYPALLRDSSVLVLAPTWIALNAAIGLWTTQSIFNMVKRPTDPRFVDQLLMGRFEPNQISVGLGIGLVLFFIGLAFWGDRFKRIRRTTIIFYGVCGGAAIVGAALLLNHSDGWPDLFRLPPLAVVLGGLFVLAGATPAALGLLADTSEAHPADRGAIMGLYSVFLALGQIVGSLLGGVAAEIRGIDGILVATLILLAIALAPLSRLRAVEHRLEPLLEEVPGGGEVSAASTAG
ncbi:MAG TPA: MFS transporter [Candidatus Limnocylindrales bacterium]